MRKLLHISLLVATTCLFAVGQTPEKQSCPTVIVEGESGIPGPGKTEHFTVAVRGLLPSTELEYFWTVEPKRNFTGQGTTTIKVEFLDYGATTATATVKGLPVGCPNTASETYIVDPVPQAKKIVTIPGYVADSKLIRSITDQLGDQPNAMLFVVMKFELGTSAHKMSAIRGRLADQLNKTNITPERLRFVLADNGKHEVVFWLVPQGAERPTAEK